MTKPIRTQQLPIRPNRPVKNILWRESVETNTRFLDGKLAAPCDGPFAPFTVWARPPVTKSPRSSARHYYGC